jgi:hypothetical protein
MFMSCQDTFGGAHQDSELTQCTQCQCPTNIGAVLYHETANAPRTLDFPGGKPGKEEREEERGRRGGRGRRRRRRRKKKERRKEEKEERGKERI